MEVYGYLWLDSMRDMFMNIHDPCQEKSKITSRSVIGGLKLQKIQKFITILFSMEMYNYFNKATMHEDNVLFFFFLSKDKKYLFMGTQYGELFICKMKKEDLSIFICFVHCINRLTLDQQF